MDSTTSNETRNHWILQEFVGARNADARWLDFRKLVKFGRTSENDDAEDRSGNDEASAAFSAFHRVFDAEGYCALLMEIAAMQDVRDITEPAELKNGKSFFVSSIASYVDEQNSLLIKAWTDAIGYLTAGGKQNDVISDFVLHPDTYSDVFHITGIRSRLDAVINQPEQFPGLSYEVDRIRANLHAVRASNGKARLCPSPNSEMVREIYRFDTNITRFANLELTTSEFIIKLIGGLHDKFKDGDKGPLVELLTSLDSSLLIRVPCFRQIDYKPKASGKELSIPTIGGRPGGCLIALLLPKNPDGDQSFSQLRRGLVRCSWGLLQAALKETDSRAEIERLAKRQEVLRFGDIKHLMGNQMNGTSHTYKELEKTIKAAAMNGGDASISTITTTFDVLRNKYFDMICIYECLAEHGDGKLREFQSLHALLIHLRRAYFVGYVRDESNAPPDEIHPPQFNGQILIRLYMILANLAHNIQKVNNESGEVTAWLDCSYDKDGVLIRVQNDTMSLEDDKVRYLRAGGEYPYTKLAHKGRQKGLKTVREQIERRRRLPDPIVEAPLPNLHKGTFIGIRVPYDHETMSVAFVFQNRKNEGSDIANTLGTGMAALNVVGRFKTTNELKNALAKGYWLQRLSLGVIDAGATNARSVVQELRRHFGPQLRILGVLAVNDCVKVDDPGWDAQISAGEWKRIKADELESAISRIEAALKRGGNEPNGDGGSRADNGPMSSAHASLPKTVLLVEDQKLPRRIIREGFETHGWAIEHEYYSSSTLVKDLTDNPKLLDGVSLAVLDYRLAEAELDGVSLGVLLKDQTGGRIKVVILSADAAEIKDEALQAGLEGAIDKQDLQNNQPRTFEWCSSLIDT